MAWSRDVAGGPVALNVLPTAVPKPLRGAFKVLMILKVASLLVLMTVQMTRGHGILCLLGNAAANSDCGSGLPLQLGGAATARHLMMESTARAPGGAHMTTWMAVAAFVGVVLAVFCAYELARRSRSCAAVNINNLHQQQQQQLLEPPTPQQQEQAPSSEQPLRIAVTVPGRRRAAGPLAAPDSSSGSSSSHHPTCSTQPSTAAPLACIQHLTHPRLNEDCMDDNNMAASCSGCYGIDMGPVAVVAEGSAAAANTTAAMDSAAIREWLRTRLAKQQRQKQDLRAMYLQQHDPAVSPFASCQAALLRASAVKPLASAFSKAAARCQPYCREDAFAELDIEAASWEDFTEQLELIAPLRQMGAQPQHL